MSPTQQARIVDLASHPHEYVTARALARYWAVSRQSVYRWVGLGVLPATRLGSDGPLRIRRHDALRFERRYQRDLFEARTAGVVRVGGNQADTP